MSMYEENCRVEAEKEHARYKKQNRILNLCALGLLILLVVWFWALFSLEGKAYTLIGGMIIFPVLINVVRRKKQQNISRYNRIMLELERIAINDRVKNS